MHHVLQARFQKVITYGSVSSDKEHEEPAATPSATVKESTLPTLSAEASKIATSLSSEKTSAIPSAIESATQSATQSAIQSAIQSATPSGTPLHEGLDLSEGYPTTPDTPISTQPSSQLHFLIPASSSNLHLCYNMASAAVSRWPVPTLLGWRGSGVLDAAVSHLAKLRVIERYLNGLPAEEDDDLVLIVDGFDVLFQLTPDVMIERYFQLKKRADEHLAKRLHMSVKDARSRGLEQTIFWGSDKYCWPMDPDAPRCWAAPESNLPHDVWGPHSLNGELIFNDPKWLNSGTVLGPVNHLRRLVTVTMAEIQATYDPLYEFRESDQFYISNVWGRQEYFRTHEAAKSRMRGQKRFVPQKPGDDPETELHATIDYESLLFQPRAFNEPFTGHVQFNRRGLKAVVDVDVLDQREAFKPIEIVMPANVINGMRRLYDSIPHTYPGYLGKDWLSRAKFGVNYATRNMYAIWHCTGPKEDFMPEQFRALWFYPYLRPLLRAAVAASQNGDLISEELIDGRQWKPKTYYPPKGELLQEFGGAWTDWDNNTFIGWGALCDRVKDNVFAGDLGTSEFK